MDYTKLNELIDLVNATSTDEELIMAVGKLEEELRNCLHHSRASVSIDVPSTVIFKFQLIDYLKKNYDSEAPFSINHMQQELGIGFNKASRTIQILENIGVCSKKDRNIPRVALVDLDEAIEIVSNYYFE